MNVLAVGAHWDDIEIGCGLTLQRLMSRGAKVYGAVLTESDYEVVIDSHKRLKSTALKEGKKAFEKLGVIHLETTPLPNQKMSYNQKVMQELEDIVREKSIDLVFTHWFGDHNTDHVATWEISRVAFRRVPNVLQYQSNSYFDNIKVFTPQFFWGFTKEEYRVKEDFLSVHQTEWNYRKDRWQREIFDRERFWGYLCGHDYAEAFMITRLVDSNKIGFYQAGE
ncbi:MAG: PIG-L deacetylase family protein [Melioribacter sp.]|uniref:PIG-L deacetylase family protein n=1 Tax=Melioribacter sp. TaxID=2052167 RepID=UPI003BBE2F98